jgi:hypothetical protein
MNKYKWTPLALAFAMSASLSHATSNPSGDVDIDNDGLIEIATLQELDLMRYDLAGTSLNGDSTGCPATGCNGYELVNDLDFDTNGNGVADAGDDFWNGGEGWDPVGDTSNTDGTARVLITNGAYNGKFNGNGRTLQNLYINRANKDWVGLFANIDEAEISNVQFQGANVVGGTATGVLSGGVNRSTVKYIVINEYNVSGYMQVGGLSGRAFGGETLLTEIAISGNISGDVYIGGLTGYAKGYNSGDYLEVKNVRSNVNLEFGFEAAGVVGSSKYISVINSVVTGNIEVSSGYSGKQVGGVVGILSDGQVLNSVSSVDIIAREGGGIIGEAYRSTVENVVFTMEGSITNSGKSAYPGGIAHLLFDSELLNSYALGELEGSYIGGAVNEVKSDVTLDNVYVASPMAFSGSNGAKMGLIYKAGSGSIVDVLDSYWDVDITGAVSSANNLGTGKTTVEMTCGPVISTACSSGAFVGWNAGDWDFGTSSDYPVLR